MEPIHLQGKSLHELQSQYYNGHRCPYCNGYTDLVDSKEVYRESHGLIYLCRPCQAWVGVHHANTDQSYGFVADKALRELRHETHKWFDPMWDAKVKAGMAKQAAQAQARKWLAKLLGIDVIICHIGMFDNEQCRKTIAECKKYWPSAEQLARKKMELENTIDMIRCLSDQHEFTLTEFQINGRFNFTMSKEGKKKVFVKLPDKLIAYDGKKIEYKPFKNLEKILDHHFQ
jgi:hypothetical protein